MAVYKRGNYWWYEFVIAGKRVRESSKSTRKAFCIEVERERRLELERALAGFPLEKREDRIRSVRQVIKDYSSAYQLGHRPQSVQFSKNRLAHADRLLGALLISDLNERTIRDYMRSRLAEKVSGRTINMELGELSRAIGKPWSQLWPKVKKLEERADVGKALTGEEERRLVQAADTRRSPVFSCFIRIALQTGMRCGEILELTWSQIDLEQKLITVGRAKTACGTGRLIPINETLDSALKAHAIWFNAAFGPARPDHHLFPFGKPMPNDPCRAMTSVKTIWNEVRREALVSCRLHDLRHTVATKLAEVGTPECTMLALLGHMSRAMLERYSHIRLAAKRLAVVALETKKESGLTSRPTNSPTQPQNCLIQ